MIDFSWKLDPSLRDLVTTGDTNPVQVQVFTNPDIGPSEEIVLEGLGLAKPATNGDGWTGQLEMEALRDLAPRSSISYIANTDIAASGARTKSPRYVPPAPAKRGHTKLPPRRE